MEIPSFWDVMSRIPLKGSRRFGGTFHLHLHRRKVRQAKPNMSCIHDFLLRLFFDPADGDGMFFRNVRYLSTDYTAEYRTLQTFALIDSRASSGIP
jgi:hypothetical protein